MRAAVLSFLVLSLLVATPSCRRSEEQDSHENGLLLLDAKDYAAASAAFHCALLNEDNALNAHLQLGMMFERDTEQLPLAVWHYRAYLTMAAPGDSQSEAVKLWLQRAERALLLSLRMKLDNSNDEERVMRVKLLEEHAQRQKNWIMDLEQENRQLRQSLAENKKTSEGASNKEN
jgi:hypothetical protein